VEFLDKRFVGLLRQINGSLDRPRVLVAVFSVPKVVKRQAGFWVTLCLAVGLGFALALLHVWERRPRRATGL
jgi:hypothetical protein